MVDGEIPIPWGILDNYAVFISLRQEVLRQFLVVF